MVILWGKVKQKKKLGKIAMVPSPGQVGPRRVPGVLGLRKLLLRKRRGSLVKPMHQAQLIESSGFTMRRKYQESTDSIKDKVT